jgi:hypothetical protein
MGQLLGDILARSAYDVQDEAHPKEKQQGQCQGMSIQREDDPTVSYRPGGVCARRSPIWSSPRQTDIHENQIGGTRGPARAPPPQSRPWPRSYSIRW